MENFFYMQILCVIPASGSKEPDSSENLPKFNITEDENSAEHVVLFTEYHKNEVSQLGTEACNCAVLDSECKLGCTVTLIL